MTNNSESMTAINAREQERFVNDMARYAKTHKDWKNLQPEAAVRSVLWVLVSDKTAFDDLLSVWKAAERADREARWCVVHDSPEKGEYGLCEYHAYSTVPVGLCQFVSGRNEAPSDGAA